MSDTAATIEELIYLSVEEGGTLTQHEADDLLAELAELRRAKWNWDEARWIKDAGLAGERISAAAMRTTGAELLTFVAGDGDAEWQTKQHGERR